MPSSIRVLTVFSAALLAAGMVHAAEAPYYNPANAANSAGLTSGYELYKTIGCPGRGILEAPCQGPAPVSAPAPAQAPAMAPAMAPKAAPAPVAPAAPAAPMDSDKDGVVDALDKCPTTPLGRTVDAMGCELDGDKDGVVDALDKCPTTPAGRTVNASGCELDGDADGVVDALDKCPTTPQGDRVDASGCTLLNTLILKGVNFDNDSATLRADATAILDEAVVVLKRYPGIKVEVAGHTDSRSDDAYNQQLSERRAKAVMDYFVSHGVPAETLSAKGYGEAAPVADNASEEGRATNRRVELRILN